MEHIIGIECGSAQTVLLFYDIVPLAVGKDGLVAQGSGEADQAVGKVVGIAVAAAVWQRLFFHLAVGVHGIESHCAQGIRDAGNLIMPVISVGLFRPQGRNLSDQTIQVVVGTVPGLPFPVCQRQKISHGVIAIQFCNTLRRGDGDPVAAIVIIIGSDAAVSVRVSRKTAQRIVSISGLHPVSVGA